jgi:hypothetical protein
MKNFSDSISKSNVSPVMETMELDNFPACLLRALRSESARIGNLTQRRIN